MIYVVLFTKLYAEARGHKSETETMFEHQRDNQPNDVACISWILNFGMFHAFFSTTRMQLF